MEAGPAGHDHRAVGGRRRDRSGDAARRGGARAGPRPEDSRRQSARSGGLDRHQERDGSAEGRLHVDRRRGEAARHLSGARNAGEQVGRLPSLPLGDQRFDRQREPGLAVSEPAAASRCDEGEAGAGHGRHRRQQLVRPLRNRGDRQGGRHQVPPRDLRRWQSGSGRDGRRRDRGHDPARGRADRDDQGQAPAAARGRGRAAGRDRRLWQRSPRSPSGSSLSRRSRPRSESSFPRACRRRLPRRWRSFGRNASAARRRSASTPRAAGRSLRPRAASAPHDIVWPTVVEDAYLLQEIGMAKASPESLGIKRP